MAGPRIPSDDDLPVVSVVFLAFDRRDELADSLTTILKDLDYPSDRLEVIVVDNASTDGTSAMVRERFDGVQLIRTPENVGVSGINLGLATGRGDWTLLLDDDCHVSGQDLRTAVRAAESHAADLVSFRVRSPDGAIFNDVYNPGLFAFWGCAALVSRRAAQALGGYDPKIFYWGNELEFTARLLDSGFTHLFLPEVVPVHRKDPSPGDAFSLHGAKTNGRHWAYAAGKLLRPTDAVTVLYALILRAIFDAHHFEAKSLKSLPDVLAGFAQGLANRRPVKDHISVAYREHCLDFAGPVGATRGPLARLRARGDAEQIDRDRVALRNKRFAGSARFYPEETASLRL